MPDTHQKLGFNPNCQKRVFVFWEKRQCFGTERTTYIAHLPNGKRGKPVLSPIERVEEVPKSESHRPERAAEYIRR